MKLLATLATLVAVSSASAITISNPLSLQTPFLVGILNGQPGDSNVATEQGYAQTILDLSLGEVDGAFAANTVFNFAGTITSNGGQQDGTSIDAGWRWALTKYDGQNGGYVLFSLGNQASTIPQYPWNLWTENHTQYALSHVTLFDGPTPPPGDDPPGDDPPNVPEGGPGVLLLGALLLGLGGLKALAAWAPSGDAYGQRA